MSRLNRLRMLRHLVIPCVASVLVLALPVRAGAQRTAFVQALLELTSAAEGTYGDEGAHIKPAIERLSATLAGWDRDIAAAEAALQTATPNAPPATIVNMRLSLARAYAERGRLMAALSELAAAGRLDPRRADVHLLRGLVLSASASHAEAIEALQRAHALEPDNIAAAYFLFREASIADNTTLVQEAAAALRARYKQVLGTAPVKNATPFMGVALLQASAAGPPVIPSAAYRQAYGRLLRGEYEAAIAEFRKAAAADPLVSDPAAGSTALTSAVAALRQGRLADARFILDRSGLQKDSSEAHRVLGLVYWADSQYDKSIEELNAAISRAPHNERARVALSRVYASAGRDADAERTLQETLQVLSDSALAHWWLATGYERVNRFADAQQEFERAAAAAIAGESQLYAAVGRLASGAADFSGAVAAFTRALAASPNDASLHKLRAIALTHLDRPDEAFAEFVTALVIDPADGEAHAGIGQIHLNAGRDAEALDAFRRALAVAPGSSETRYAMATALARLGKKEEAAEHFARVEQAQRQMLSDRRRTLSYDVLKEEAALRASEGRFDTAIELYEKAIALGAEPAVYGQLATLYARVGRSPDAARAKAMYEKAMQDSRAGSPAR